MFDSSNDFKTVDINNDQNFDVHYIKGFNVDNKVKTVVLSSLQIASKDSYNIPRACLLKRLPVQAMDLKSNRSGFQRHKLEICRRLR